MPGKRRHLGPDHRNRIYSKYYGHCAYCGKKIAYKEMQIDHIVPVSRGGDNQDTNLLPACRMCNYYKRNFLLEEYRNEVMALLHKRASRPFIVRIAINYGVFKVEPFDGLFFFEKIDKGDIMLENDTTPKPNGSKHKKHKPPIVKKKASEKETDVMYKYGVGEDELSKAEHK